MTHLHFNKLVPKLSVSLLIGLCCILASEYQAEAEIQYFSQPEMDYWKKPGTQRKTDGPQTPSPSSSLPSVKESSFSWKKHMDPKNDEFFREGEYLPPAPFMEIARDPSDENIDRWFKYLEAKNEITRRLQTKLSEYAAKHPHQVALGDVQPPPIRVAEPIVPNQDARRYRLRLYFDSKCPHCERMIGTLKSLSQRGYSIELKQLDSDTQVRSRIPFPVSAASAAELKQYKIESVPVLLVGDLKARSYFKIQGYQSEGDVLKALTESTQSKQDAIQNGG